MITDDELLERVVAGIQATTSEKAEVRWNQHINGRQFDVVVRFNVGPHHYLALFEVKDRKRRAEASDIEAFVTKGRDQKANKLIFVTKAGFQQAALAVAERHGVDLFTLTFDEDAFVPPHPSGILALHKPGTESVPRTLEISGKILTARFEKIALIYVGGKPFPAPSETSQLGYYMPRTRLDDGRSLEDIIDSIVITSLSEGEVIEREIKIDPPQRITPPDDYFFPPGTLTGVHCTITGRMCYTLSGNVKVDPGMFTWPVVYTNALTGDAQQFTLGQLPLNLDAVRSGEFYFNTNPLNYFYCARTEGGTVYWWLIESFQHGNLVTAEITQDLGWAHTYIPVSNKATLARLRKRLVDFCRSRGLPVPNAGGTRSARRAAGSARPRPQSSTGRRG